MTEAVRQLLWTFDTLSLAEQQQTATEILRRWVPNESLSDDALNELADELFRAYDAEAADCAAP